MEFVAIIAIFALLTVLSSAIRPKGPNNGMRRGSSSGFMPNMDGSSPYDYSDGTHSSSHHHCGDSGHSSSYDGGSCDSGGGDGGGGGGE